MIDTQELAHAVTLQAPRSGPFYAAYRWADTLHRIALSDLDDMQKLRFAVRLADAKHRLVCMAQAALTLWPVN